MLFFPTPRWCNCQMVLSLQHFSTCAYESEAL